MPRQYRVFIPSSGALMMAWPPTALAAAGRALALAAAIAVTLPVWNAARAERLVIDQTQHLIAITTRFRETNVDLFGAIQGTDGDVVVTVRGPEMEQLVRRKQRLAGLWLNGDKMIFRDVPAYYAVAASRPLHLIASREVLARSEIGVGSLRLEPVGDGAARPPDQVEAFRAALIRSMQRSRLYNTELAPVTFVDEKRFRATLQFPVSVSQGIYQVGVFLLQGGQVVDAQRNPMVISRVGLEADLYDFAASQPTLYAAIAAVIALVSGYLAGLAGLMFPNEAR
jgi:uncharacterized protein (TIGR02186 family)